MRSVSKALAMAVSLSAAGCARVDLGAPHSTLAAPQTPQITKSSLQGVWEVVSCYALHHLPGDAKSMANFKYCFNSETAYPGLSPDSASDSADGGGDYYIVGGNIMVIRTGVPGGIYAYNVEVLNDKLILSDERFQTTLRRIAKSWDGKAPIIRPREIPIT